MCWLVLVMTTMAAVEAMPRRYRRAADTAPSTTPTRRGKSLGFYQPSYMNSPVMYDPAGLLEYEDALAAALASATYQENGKSSFVQRLKVNPATLIHGNITVYLH